MPYSRRCSQNSLDQGFILHKRLQIRIFKLEPNPEEVTLGTQIHHVSLQYT
jgi:hypothetical protein